MGAALGLRLHSDLTSLLLYSFIPMPLSSEKRVMIFGLLLVAATLAFYNPIVRNQFTDFDDSVYILKNSQVQTGLTWATFKWSFTTFHAGYWHPITWLSHALDCELFHLNPVGHHYINLLLHAANTALLFLLLWRATGLTWPSLVVGALFALHPINVESVAWVAERKNVLSMLFFLLALHAYDRYARSGRRLLYGGVVVLFALGLMAKPQIVTFPFVLLLWDYWPLERMAGPQTDGSGEVTPTRRSLRFLFLEKVPLFVLAAADSVITVIAQHAGAAVRTSAEVPVSARIANVFVSYVRYLGDLFWPSRLAPMYPHPGNSLPPAEIAGALAILLLITAMVWYWRGRRYLTVGWCWFLGTLVPMIGIITVGEQAMADRFAYIPCIGVFVAVAWALNDWVVAGAFSQRRIRSASLAAAAVIVALICGALTYRQLGYWRDDETLWRYTLSVTERNYMAHDNLALALAKQGRSEEALVEFHAAEALHKYPLAQVLELAWYEDRVGHPEEAVEECNSILQNSTDQSDPKLRAATWIELGQAQLELHQYEQASESYESALRLSTDNEAALVGLGVLAMRAQEFDDAVNELQHAVKLDPSAVDILLLARALRLAGRPAEADAATAEAQKISPDVRQSQMEVGRLLNVAGVVAPE